MSTEPIQGERVCPDRECQGFGHWEGDRSRGELLVRCVNPDCSRQWTAPDRSD